MTHANDLLLSRAGRKRIPRIFNDGTTAAESPRHSSAEDDLSPMALDVKERLEKPQSDSHDGSRASNGTTSGRSGSGAKGGRKRKPRSTGGGIFKRAAVRVLTEEGRLMTTGDITKVALQRGYISRTGKTPEATMASALYSEIKRRATDTVFVRPQEGLFGLKDWPGNDVGSGASQDQPNCGHGANTNVQQGPIPPSRLGQQLCRQAHTPADTTGSRCLALPHPRDGLIDLLSAAERVGGNVIVSPVVRTEAFHAVQAIEAAEKAPVLPHRRKVLIAANKNQLPVHVITDAANNIPTASERGSIGGFGFGERGNSAEQNNNIHDPDEDVQSPQTRVLEGLHGFIGCQAKEKDISGANPLSWQLRDIRDCIAECPIEVTRKRAQAAFEDLERRLVTRGDL